MEQRRLTWYCSFIVYVLHARLERYVESRCTDVIFTLILKCVVNAVFRECVASFVFEWMSWPLLKLRVCDGRWNCSAWRHRAFKWNVQVKAGAGEGGANVPLAADGTALIHMKGWNRTWTSDPIWYFMGPHLPITTDGSLGSWICIGLQNSVTGRRGWIWLW